MNPTFYREALRKSCSWLIMIIILLVHENAHAQEFDTIVQEFLYVAPFIVVACGGIMWIRDLISTNTFIGICLFAFIPLFFANGSPLLFH